MEEIIVELTVNENDDTGVNIISFVESPAIEVDFMYFNDKKTERFKTVDTDKRIVVGAAMLPNEKIIRYDADDNPYFVYFSKETIKKCSELFEKEILEILDSCLTKDEKIEALRNKTEHL